jgi:hypothetical protein
MFVSDFLRILYPGGCLDAAITAKWYVTHELPVSDEWEMITPMEHGDDLLST